MNIAILLRVAFFSFLSHSVLAEAKKAFPQVEYNLESEDVSFRLNPDNNICFVDVLFKGTPVGYFIPHNSSSDPSLDAAYFGLAHIMNLGDYFQKSLPYVLGPDAVQKFKNQILANTNLLKRAGFQRTKENCNKIFFRISKNSKSLNGVFKFLAPTKTSDFDQIVNPFEGENGEPKHDHEVMKALQADQPWPGAEKTLVFDGFSAKVSDLAASYGVTMMFDALLGQWNRYSGSNVSVFFNGENKSFGFYLRENGGAGGSLKWSEKHLSWMSRYPVQVVGQFAMLEDFLSGRIESFHGFTEPYDLIQQVGLVYDKSPETYRKQLVTSLQLIREEVSKNVEEFGRKKVFYSLED